MRFTADLHIHSRFSRATSSRLNPRTLGAWAMVKGIDVLGTGDFTHPAWRAELAEALVRDERSGLYRLREAPDVGDALPGLDGLEAAPPLFLWQTEISSIYTRHGKGRRVHNLVFFPDLEGVEAFSRRLEAIGNLGSDGRPILGLDARDLLEMVLEGGGTLIPAHAWTPWFAVFGSKSGFDSLEACFGDLASEIFALETGLSSDPAMNRLWSRLDGCALISNSDAHSGEHLGREVNLFSGRPSYDGIFGALRGGGDCVARGTMEFFPEEGKYHLDGHRACGVMLEPDAALAHGNICPVCGRPLTIGVLHRVLELADRRRPVWPEGAADAASTSLIPLPELLGELLGVGSKSRRVQERYTALLREFGPELGILRTLDTALLGRRWEALGEGVARMRRGEVLRQGGFDGQYGTVRVFTPQERQELAAGRRRAALPGLELSPAPRRRAAPRRPAPETPVGGRTAGETPGGASGNMPATNAGTAPADPVPAASVADPVPVDPALAALTPDQRTAALAGLDPARPVLVAAGPGSGKTRTLTARLEWLLRRGADPDDLLALTFTRRAAAEIRQRLKQRPDQLPGGGPRCDTLHALAFRLRGAAETAPPLPLSEEDARRVFAAANPDSAAPTLRAAWDDLQRLRERLEPPPPSLAPLLERYAARKARLGLADYTDLLEWLLRTGTSRRWKHVLVDEAQDLSPLQLAALRVLLADPSGAGFFGIGDPDQAIYGFRGALDDIESALRVPWPHLEVHGLRQSHRAAPGILDAANALLGAEARCGRLRSCVPGAATLQYCTAPSAADEARWLAAVAARLLGSGSHTLADADRTRTGHLDAGSCAPGDIGVLLRLKAQAPLLRQALEQRGVPCAVPEAEGFWRHPGVAALLAEARRRAASPDCPVSAPSAPLPASSAPDAPDAPDVAAVLAACPAPVWDGGPDALRRWLSLRAAPAVLGPLFWESAPCRQWRALWDEAGDWTACCVRCAFMQDREQLQARAERVQLLTLHAAKGLEFRVVFLPGLEDGLLPLRRPLLTGRPVPPGHAPDADFAEERRLLYVGITRAAEAVFCSRAVRRTLYGNVLQLRPSPFLAGFAACLTPMTPPRRSAGKEARQCSLFG